MADFQTMAWDNRPRWITGMLIVCLALLGISFLPWNPWVLRCCMVLASGLFLWSVVHQNSESNQQLAQLDRESKHSLSEWKQRWQDLHDQTRQHATVLLQMSDGVVVLDRDRCIRMMNPSARQMLGLRGNNPFTGRDFREIARIPEIVAAIDEVIETSATKRVTVEISDQGVIRPISVNVSQIESSGQGNLLLAIHDEAESRRLETVRREFVANVSHEIKTPLAAIKGYAETVELAMQDDPQAASHFMSQIRNQCVRLERLVADMMQLARAQAGSEKLVCAHVSLGEVILESLKTYQPVAQAKEIRLEKNRFDENAMAYVDREAMLTIANNLIGNAIRYTPEGGHVEVQLLSEKEHSVLVVQDNGVGIAESELDRIFERFYRVEKTREAITSGTGLGLAIVRNLVVALRGEIDVQSHTGQGSKFSVRMPRFPQHNAGSGTNESLSGQSAPAGQSLMGLETGVVTPAE